MVYRCGNTQSQKTNHGGNEHENEESKDLHEWSVH